MSVEELKFKDEMNEGQHLTFKFKNNVMYLHTHNDDPSPLEFDRSEVYLLMLWLQEHLK